MIHKTLIRVKREHTKPKNLHDSVFMLKKRQSRVENKCVSKIKNHIIVQFHSAETIRRELLMAVNPQGEQQK